MIPADLITQIERRFADAAPDDTATNDRLAYFTEGFIGVGHGMPGPAPKDDAILAEWRRLGYEVAKWQQDQAARQDVKVDIVVGTPQEQ